MADLQSPSQPIVRIYNPKTTVFIESFISIKLMLADYKSLSYQRERIANPPRRVINLMIFSEKSLKTLDGNFLKPIPFSSNRYFPYKPLPFPCGKGLPASSRGEPRTAQLW